jgi:hypothetical protein
LEETAKYSLQRRTEYLERSKSATLLPPELQRLFLLDPICRQCFVLRVLVGLAPAACAGILGLSEWDFEEGLYAAFQDLALIETRTPASFSHFESGHLSSTSRPASSESRPPSSWSKFHHEYRVSSAAPEQ